MVVVRCVLCRGGVGDVAGRAEEDVCGADGGCARRMVWLMAKFGAIGNVCRLLITILS